jgi:hypothetical protein
MIYIEFNTTYFILGEMQLIKMQLIKLNRNKKVYQIKSLNA